jgi:MarR family transcriptional regulator, organic hydroperoxide resistance regulator
VTQFSGPGESPGFLMWQATRRWQRELTAALKPLDLTHVQFVLLASVWWLEKPTQRELADAAATDPMMTSQVVRALEKRGLVERRPDPADARVRRLVATRRGRGLATRAIEVVEAADAEFFARVDTGTLIDTLRGLIRA